MTNEEHLATLYPGCAKRVRAWLLSCEATGCPMRITQSRRSPQEQAAIYAQGRQSIETVNTLRAEASLPPIAVIDNKIVTKAPPGYSMHEYGLAADLCYAEGDPYGEIGHSLTWTQIGQRAEHAGLVWGGRFTTLRNGVRIPTPDLPHGQWTGNLTEAQVRAGMLPDDVG